MISWIQVHAGIYGAWRLARRDPGGMVWFDATPSGLWASFWAAVLVFPAMMVLDVLTGGFGPHPGGREMVVKLISYVIDWTAFPLVMVVVADSLGKFPAYWRFIVAYNWSAVVQVGVLLPLVALAVLVPVPATMLLVQAMTILLLVYRAYIAHVALGVGLLTALGITIMDTLLTLVVDRIGVHLLTN